ncbi:unnamed protein product [Leptosia nina]|uniref:Fidgetin-like protein 1 n=1 Tax=Leptosia nina TaxID=320188 RepID=A0AAV1JW89_9NEOP
MREGEETPHLGGKALLLNNNNLVQQYRAHVTKSSNVVQNIVLNEMFQDNSEKLVDNLDHIFECSQPLLLNHDSNNSSKWRSTLSTFSDPVSVFEKSISSCKDCENLSVDANNFLKSNCKCAMMLSMSKENVCHNVGIENSPQEITSYDEHRFKPKFNKFKQAKKVSIHTEAEDNKMKTSSELDDAEHKHQVAKIMFKTAKEQFLASNPAAKRSLGASRKAQSKFVSPMIGSQEKQEVKDSMNNTDSDKLKNIDQKMIELIENEIIDKGVPIGWDDIAGLQMAKSVIQEAVVWPLLRPDIFTGLRRPPRGILLFGPPGTGKTLIGKCVAAQCNATFFCISASSLTSKWIGDGEKMVRALFSVARYHQPSVIFIDEIDSLLTQRNETEHEATRRIKTEFLVQLDGAATADEDRLLIIGATNRPQELDEAARRRLVKRLYIPLPDVEARRQIISNLLQTENNDLTHDHIMEVAQLTEGYSGADMKSLCSEAAMGPIRAVPISQIVTIDKKQVRPVTKNDFKIALQRVRPSVSQDDLGQFVKWDKIYGQGF